jgi:hypothetical protein
MNKILTPYQATKIMNAHRIMCGLKPVKSPMIYIQASKGRFPVEINEDGRKEITDVDAFIAWVVEHNTRQVARKVTVQEETEKVTKVMLAITAG